MDRGIISMRYARALMLHAAKYGEQDKVYGDTLALIDSYRTYPALVRVLDNKLLPAGEKVRLITLCSGGKSTSARFRDFIALVVEQRREEFLQNICVDYRQLWRQDNNMLDVEVTTASAIDAGTKKVFAEKLARTTGKKVMVTTTTDPSLIGGFVLRWDTYRLDSSVKAALNRIEKMLMQ